MNKNPFRQLFSVDYWFESQQSTKELLFMVYGWRAGYVKNLLLTGFEFFSRQVGIIEAAYLSIRPQSRTDYNELNCYYVCFKSS